MGEESYESGQVYKIPVQDGYVVDPPVWEDFFPAARNWLALVAEDPERPQGMTRDFCERGKGRFRYSVGSLAEGDTVEFGADRMRSADRRDRVRWYGEVVRVTGTELLVRYFETADEMFSTISDRESRLQEAEAS